VAASASWIEPPKNVRSTCAAPIDRPVFGRGWADRCSSCLPGGGEVPLFLPGLSTRVGKRRRRSRQNMPTPVEDRRSPHAHANPGRKGHLTHRQEGMSYIYQPSRARTPAGQSPLRQVLRTFFGGSIQEALAAHLADEDAELQPEDLEKMASFFLIRKARKEGR